MIRFPKIVTGANVVVSATMFLTYLRCPDQALARQAGSYPADSRTSFRGGLAHRIFARHLASGSIEPGDFEQACREEIGQGLNPKVGSLGLKPSELAGVISEVGELYARFKRLSAEGFIEAEVFIEAEPAPGVILRGSIDAVFQEAAFNSGLDGPGLDGPGLDRPAQDGLGRDESGRVRLIDWKTGQLGQSQDQLWFYAMLWALDKGVVPARIEAMSVATGERWEAEPAEEDLARTVEKVAELVGEIRRATEEGESLERIPGPWCRYCPVLDSCDEGQAADAVFSA